MSSQNNQLYNALANIQAASQRAEQRGTLEIPSDDDGPPPPPPNDAPPEPHRPIAMNTSTPTNQFQQQSSQPYQQPLMSPMAQNSPYIQQQQQQPLMMQQKPLFPQQSLSPQSSFSPQGSFTQQPHQQQQPLMSPQQNAMYTQQMQVPQRPIQQQQPQQQQQHQQQQSQQIPMPNALTRLNLMSPVSGGQSPFQAVVTPVAHQQQQHQQQQQQQQQQQPGFSTPLSTPCTTPVLASMLQNTPVSPSTTGQFQPVQHTRKLPGQNTAALHSANERLIAMSQQQQQPDNESNPSLQHSNGSRLVASPLSPQRSATVTPSPLVQPSTSANIPGPPPMTNSSTSHAASVPPPPPSSSAHSAGGPTSSVNGTVGSSGTGTIQNKQLGLLAAPNSDDDDEGDGYDQDPTPIKTMPFISPRNHVTGSNSVRGANLALSPEELDQLRQSQRSLGAEMANRSFGAQRAGARILPPLQTTGTKSSKFQPFSPANHTLLTPSNQSTNAALSGQHDPYFPKTKELTVRQSSAAYAFALKVEEPTVDETNRPLTIRGGVFDPNKLQSVPSSGSSAKFSPILNPLNDGTIPPNQYPSSQVSPSNSIAGGKASYHFDLQDDEILGIGLSTVTGAKELQGAQNDRITRSQAKESIKQKVIQQHQQEGLLRGGYQDVSTDDATDDHMVMVNPLTQRAAIGAVTVEQDGTKMNTVRGPSASISPMGTAQPSNSANPTAFNGNSIRDNKDKSGKSKLLGLFSRGDKDKTPTIPEFPDEMWTGGRETMNSNAGRETMNDGVEFSQAVIQTNALLTPLHSPRDMTFLISKFGKSKAKKLWLYQCRHRFRVYLMPETDRRAADKKHNYTHIRNIRGGIRGCGSARCRNYVYSEYSRILPNLTDEGCQCERLCNVCDRCAPEYESFAINDITKITLGTGVESAVLEKHVYARNDCIIDLRDGSRYHWIFPDTYSRNLFVGQAYYLQFSSLHINSLHLRHVLFQERARYHPQNDTIAGDWNLYYNGLPLDIDDSKYPLRKKTREQSGGSAQAPPITGATDGSDDAVKQVSRSYPAPLILLKQNSLLFGPLLALSLDNMVGFQGHYNYIQEVTQELQFSGGMDLLYLFEYLTASRIYDIIGINIYDTYKRYRTLPSIHDAPSYITTFEHAPDHFKLLQTLLTKGLLNSSQTSNSSSPTAPNTNNTNHNNGSTSPKSNHLAPYNPANPQFPPPSASILNTTPSANASAYTPTNHTFVLPTLSFEHTPPPPPPPPIISGLSPLPIPITNDREDSSDHSNNSQTVTTTPLSAFPVPNAPMTPRLSLSQAQGQMFTQRSTFIALPSQSSSAAAAADAAAKASSGQHDHYIPFDLTDCNIFIPPFTSATLATGQDKSSIPLELQRQQQQIMAYVYKHRSSLPKLFPHHMRTLSLLWSIPSFQSLSISLQPPLLTHPTYPLATLVHALSQYRQPVIPQLVGWPNSHCADAKTAGLPIKSSEADATSTSGNMVNLQSARMLPSARRKQQQILEEQEKQKSQTRGMLASLMGTALDSYDDPNDRNIPFGATASIYGDFAFPPVQQYDSLPLVTTPPIYVPPALTIFSSTWNAGAKALPKPDLLREWLGANNNQQIDGLRAQKRVNQRVYQDTLFSDAHTASVQQGHGILLTETAVGAVGSDLIVIGFQENKNIDVWVTAITKYLNDPQQQQLANDRAVSLGAEYQTKLQGLSPERRAELFTSKKVPLDSTLALAGIFPDVTIVDEKPSADKNKKKTKGTSTAPTSSAATTTQNNQTAQIAGHDHDEFSDDNDSDDDDHEQDGPIPQPTDFEQHADLTTPSPLIRDKKGGLGGLLSKIKGDNNNNNKDKDVPPPPPPSESLPDLSAPNDKDRSAFQQQHFLSQSTNNSAHFTYQLVLAKGFWEIGLCIFVRSDRAHLIGDRYVETVATGIGNVIGNKGAIGAYVNIANTPMLFVSSHMVAREERLSQRNQNYNRIISELSNKLLPKLSLTVDVNQANVVPALATSKLISNACSSTTSATNIPLKDILSHVDVVMWVGDLNYRTIVSFEDAITYCKNSNLAPLAACDQLTFERAAWRVFVGFEEGPLDFTPTYRWNRGECSFSNKRAQPPSWTDRILYKRSTPDILTLLSYGARHNCIVSDHRPVIASFAFVPRGFDLANTKPLASDYSKSGLQPRTFRQLKEVATSLVFARTIPRQMATFKANDRTLIIPSNLTQHEPYLADNQFDPNSSILQACGCIGNCMCQEQFSLPLRPHEQEIDDTISKVITVTTPVFDIELVDMLLIPITIIPLVKPEKKGAKGGKGGDDDGVSTPMKGKRAEGGRETISQPGTPYRDQSMGFPRSESSVSENSVDNFAINEAHQNYGTSSNAILSQSISNFHTGTVLAPAVSTTSNGSNKGAPPPPPPPPRRNPSGSQQTFNAGGTSLELGANSGAVNVLPSPAQPSLSLQPSKAQQAKEQQQSTYYSQQQHQQQLQQSNEPVLLTAQTQVIPTISPQNIVEILEVHSKNTKNPKLSTLKLLFPFFNAIVPPQNVYTTPLSAFSSAQVVNYNYFHQREQDKSLKNASKHIAFIFSHPHSNKLAVSPPVIATQGVVSGNTLLHFTTTCGNNSNNNSSLHSIPPPQHPGSNSSFHQPLHNDDYYDDRQTLNQQAMPDSMIDRTSLIKSGQYTSFVAASTISATSTDYIDELGSPTSAGMLLNNLNNNVVNNSGLLLPSPLGGEYGHTQLTSVTQTTSTQPQMATFYPVGSTSYIRTDCRDPIALATTSISMTITGSMVVKTSFGKKSSTEVIGYASIPLKTAVRSYALSLLQQPEKNNTLNTKIPTASQQPSQQIEPLLVPVLANTGALIGIVKVGVKLVRSDRSELS